MGNIGKKAAAALAATLIEEGMIVGLGSGSTSAFFIEELGARCQQGLKIKAVSSSRLSTQLAQKHGIEVFDINSVSHIDCTVDGADEIDKQKRMIKGGGGALFREKILASSSKEMIVIVDESKLVNSVGVGKLPVEIAFFGSPAIRSKIESIGYSGQWRLNHDETLFITENGNLIFDIQFKTVPHNPIEIHLALKQIPGVIETGFFFSLAGRVIIGYESGVTEILT